MQYLVRIALTALVVVGVAELGKRSSFWGAVLASLPLTSLLAFIWLYVESGDREAVARLSTSIFWLVLPSLPLFLVLSALLRAGWPFWWSLSGGGVAAMATYFAMISALRHFQIKL
jgi:hypothetical protein